MYATLRCAPLVVRVVLGEEARVTLLTDDYASDAARGDDADAWLARMEDSVSRLGKRLGGAEVQKLVEALRAGEYAAVARRLLQYYDKLYDAHVANGSGSGSGCGTRPGVVLDAVLPEELTTLDAERVAALVLERVADFEAAEEREAEAEGGGP